MSTTSSPIPLPPGHSTCVNKRDQSTQCESHPSIWLIVLNKSRKRKIENERFEQISNIASLPLSGGFFPRTSLSFFLGGFLCSRIDNSVLWFLCIIFACWTFSAGSSSSSSVLDRVTVLHCKNQQLMVAYPPDVSV